MTRWPPLPAHIAPVRGAYTEERDMTDKAEIEALVKLLHEATFTKGRIKGGVCGQTIEASMRSTFHEVSAWDLDTAAVALTALQADLAAAVAAKEAAEGRCLTATTIGRAQSLALYRWEDWDVADMASAVKVIQAVAALPDAKGEK